MKNWNKCISLSYDGGGESYSTVLSSYIDGKKKIISKQRWPNSLGHFYSFFTGYLGFKMLEGEYKMMGLAPYGEPIWTDLILDKILVLKNNGKYQFNTQLCDYHAALKGVFDPTLEKLFCKRRKDNLDPDQEQINLATSVQHAFEKALIHILEPSLLSNPKIKKLVISGGCALNVTANGKLLSSKIFDEIIIPPAPHDAGCAIGAVLCVLDKLKIPTNSKSVTSPFLGRKYSTEAIKKDILEFCNFLPEEYEEASLINETANLLSQGNLIAWFQNASEFGPRALGSRSFLADPRNDKIREEINIKIKKRELFRPFAPSVIEEASSKFFEINQTSPYMNIVSKVKDDRIPAITHIDGTARVHTVSKNINKKYHALISKFGEITGIPVLLNTSFNIQEPIVYSPKDALRTFLESKVDALVIGNFIIKRNDID